MENFENIAKCSEYILRHHKQDVVDIITGQDIEEHYSILISFITLMDEERQLFELIESQPLQALSLMETGIQRAMKQIFEEDHLELDGTCKGNVHARITCIRNYDSYYCETVPKTCDVGSLLCVAGTVIRTTLVKLLEYQREYSCVKCKHLHTVSADYEQFYAISQPQFCENPEGCTSNHLIQLHAGEPVYCKDYQEIKIQEQVSNLSVGTIPRSMWVTLEDDLVDVCKPGDDIEVCGIVRRRWKPLTRDKRNEIELVFMANHVLVKSDEKSRLVVTDEVKQEFQEFWDYNKNYPLRGRNHIILSFCPQVFGLYLIKLSVTLVLIGGQTQADEAGTKVRDRCHLLLVGDPGTGKSQFLKYAAKVCSRSVLTTGIGSTSAGLTVTASKDSGEWQLEAGALVLADGGVCCIDEFNSIREHDRASIHEAMEQQTISVAKAGLVCKLNSRCTVVASTNPKGSYDPEEPLSVNVALGTPLLSRFDLILVLLDTRNSEWDKIVSSYILQGKLPHEDETMETKNLWDLDKMRAYLSYVKTIDPILTKDANIVLKKYYQIQRQHNEYNQSRTTVRLLESMVRLSVAHARLMFRQEVLVVDAIVVITLVEASMQGSALIKGINPLHTAFPKDPEKDYIHQLDLILNTLELKDVLIREKKRIRTESGPIQPHCNQKQDQSKCDNNDSGSETRKNSSSHNFTLLNPKTTEQNKENIIKNANTKHIIQENIDNQFPQTQSPIPQSHQSSDEEDFWSVKEPPPVKNKISSEYFSKASTESGMIETIEPKGPVCDKGETISEDISIPDKFSFSQFAYKTNKKRKSKSSHNSKMQSNNTKCDNSKNDELNNSKEKIDASVTENVAMQGENKNHTSAVGVKTQNRLKKFNYQPISDASIDKPIKVVNETRKKSLFVLDDRDEEIDFEIPPTKSQKIV